LAKVAPSITITPSVGTDSSYDLTPGSEIGAVLAGDLAIEIQPKIPIDRVLFMVSYALDPKRWRENPFQFPESSLVEAVIPGFMAQVRRAFHRGILQSYRSEEAALTTIRGRLRFDDQIRKRFGFFPPAEVRYDEFTEDIELNRLIKAAIASLGRTRIRSDEARRSLRTFDSLLSTVSLVDYHPQRLPDIHFDRLNEHYRPAINLARLILRSMAFELAHGSVCAASFLIDMNKAFEDFVVVALRETLGLSNLNFPQGAKGRNLSLDEAGLVNLEPDISWWEGGRCTFVGDIKYKLLDAASNKNADLYQLLAYVTATGLQRGLLIYAAGEKKPAVHQVVNIGSKLELLALDLSGTPETILQQIGELARHVRRLRNETMIASAFGGTH
jgi:5-methylcytosine-specific restriction enzyme subunit McrC